jgi:hypothetical protein
MIKLKDLLKEFEFGEKLFADPDDPIVSRGNSTEWTAFMRKVYNSNYESNTNDETYLLNAIKTYLNSSDKKDITPDMLKDLLSIRNKFPNILMPPSHITTLYRGMTMDMNSLIKIVQDATEIKKEGHDDKRLILKDISRTITSRAKDFISISTDWRIAQRFPAGNITAVLDSGRYPVVAVVDVQDVKDRVLMNPEFLDAIIGFRESECWIVGSDIPVSVLITTNPIDRYDVLHRDFGPEVKDLIQALKSKGV